MTWSEAWDKVSSGGLVSVAEGGLLLREAPAHEGALEEIRRYIEQMHRERNPDDLRLRQFFKPKRRRQSRAGRSGWACDCMRVNANGRCGIPL